MAVEPQSNEQVPKEALPAEKKKKSFVDDRDAPPVGKGPVEQKIVPCEVSLMLIYNQSKNQTELLTEIRDLMRNGVSQVANTVVSKSEPAPAVTPEPTPAPVQTPAQTQPAPVTSAPTPAITPRLQEIITAIEPIKDLVFIDEQANDNMFYIIRPRQFLGSENFSKVGAIMRQIGAQYQSAGKNSHFKASKAGKQ